MQRLAGRGLSSAVVMLFALRSHLASVNSVAVANLPKSNLLQASRHVAVSNSSTDAVHGGEQQPDSFFTKDFEKMDELQNDHSNKKRQCHPKCKWDCGTTSCNQKCEPRCQPPKCVTACKKPTMAKCQRTCKDPQCAVVCPPQCEHGECPKCKTVCGESICALECGQNRCESQCADPECAWDCKADMACAKPTCKMTCDSTVCAFGKDQKLPSEIEAPFVGQEVAWKGLGKIPEEHLAEFAPQTLTGAQLPTGAEMFGGSKPLPKGGLESIKAQSFSVEPEVTEGVRWVNSAAPKQILAPSR